MPVDDRSTDDRALVRACIEGDVAAFEPLVHRYEKAIFNIAYRMVGDVEDARDITQTTFVKAYEKLSLFDPKYRFFSWIYRIGVNESLNFVQRRKPSVAVDERLAWSGRTPEEDHRINSRNEHLLAAVRDLSPDHRTVIVLRHFMHQSYQEISVVLQIPEKTVKSRLFSARHKLRDALVQQEMENP